MKQPPPLSIQALRSVRDKEEEKRDLARKHAENILRCVTDGGRESLTPEEEFQWRGHVEEMRKYAARVDMINGLIGEMAVE